MIGQDIFNARKRLKMTQQALCDKAGLSKGYLSKIENGLDTNVGRDILERIAAILKHELSLKPRRR